MRQSTKQNLTSGKNVVSVGLKHNILTPLLRGDYRLRREDFSVIFTCNKISFERDDQVHSYLTRTYPRDLVEKEVRGLRNPLWGRALIANLDVCTY